MLYSEKDIYEGFTFKNRKGKGQTYICSNTSGSVTFTLTGAPGVSYSAQSYEFKLLLKSLNDGDFIEQKQENYEIF